MYGIHHWISPGESNIIGLKACLLLSYNNHFYIFLFTLNHPCLPSQDYPSLLLRLSPNLHQISGFTTARCFICQKYLILKTYEVQIERIHRFGKRFFWRWIYDCVSIEDGFIYSWMIFSLKKESLGEQKPILTSWKHNCVHKEDLKC